MFSHSLKHSLIISSLTPSSITAPLWRPLLPLTTKRLIESADTLRRQPFWFCVLISEHNHLLREGWSYLGLLCSYTNGNSDTWREVLGCGTQTILLEVEEIFKPVFPRTTDVFPGSEDFHTAVGRPGHVCLQRQHNSPCWTISHSWLPRNICCMTDWPGLLQVSQSERVPVAWEVATLAVAL